MKVEGATALVTGANRGLGAAAPRAPDPGQGLRAARDTEASNESFPFARRYQRGRHRQPARMLDVSIASTTRHPPTSDRWHQAHRRPRERAENEFFGPMRMAQTFAPVSAEKVAAHCETSVGLLVHIDAARRDLQCVEGARGRSRTPAPGARPRTLVFALPPVHRPDLPPVCIVDVIRISVAPDRRGHRSRRRVSSRSDQR